MAPLHTLLSLFLAFEYCSEFVAAEYKLVHSYDQSNWYDSFKYKTVRLPSPSINPDGIESKRKYRKILIIKIGG